MTSKRSRAKPQANLPPPSIPAAFDGGLGYNDIEADPNSQLVVLVGPWADFEDGDTLQILWGEERTVVATYAASMKDASRVFAVDVPVGSVKRAGEGTRSVRCRVIPRIGDTIDSPAFPVEVKFSVPGGIDPRPDTPYRNENLALPTVVPSPVPEEATEVVVHVAPYANMAVEDVVTVSWAGLFVSAPPLTGTGQTIAIVIDRATLERAGGGDLPVTYQVYDRVNNWSRWAPEAITEVRIEDPAAILPPWVHGTEGDAGKVLDLDKLGKDDVQVTVDAYADSVAGDVVVVHWQGTTTSGRSVRFDTDPKTQARAHGSLSFVVPNAQATPLAQGSASVSYTLTTPNGKTLLSRRRYLGITGAVKALPPPSVKQAKGNTLDPADTPLGATVTVAAWPGMIAGDRLTLTWQGRQKNGQPTYYEDDRILVGDDVGKELAFIVPLGEVTVLVDGNVELYYAIDTAGTRDARGIRTIRLLSRLESPHLVLDVRDATGERELPPPTVDKTHAGQLDPFDALDGIVVRIPKTDLVGVDKQVTVTILGSPSGTATTPPRDGNPAGMTFTLAAGLVSSNLGRDVTIHYTVVPKAGGASRVSPAFALKVLDIAPEESRIGRPGIVQAGANFVLDLDTFAGDATVSVPAWPWMAIGQRFWLKAWSGGASSAIATNQPVAAIGSFQRALARTWLSTLADGSTLTIELKIAFDGGTEGTARTFTSPPYSLHVSPANPWDLEFDFEKETIRHIAPGGALQFGNLMTFLFDPQHRHPDTEKIGVAQFAYTLPDFYEGKVLYIGNPPGKENDVYAFCNFAEGWSTVRFAVTSVDRAMTISFKDDNLQTIGGIVTLPGGDVNRGHDVRCDAPAGRKIRHLEIRSKDVIRLDFFKFKGNA